MSRSQTIPRQFVGECGTVEVRHGHRWGVSQKLTVCRQSHQNSLENVKFLRVSSDVHHSHQNTTENGFCLTDGVTAPLKNSTTPLQKSPLLVENVDLLVAKANFLVEQLGQAGSRTEKKKTKKIMLPPNLTSLPWKTSPDVRVGGMSRNALKSAAVGPQAY